MTTAKGSHDRTNTASVPRRSSQEKRIVYIHVNFIRVGEINTLKETFDAEIMIKSRWREPSLDGMKGDLSLEQQWNPQISIENVVGDPQTKVFLSTERNAEDETFVVERKKFRGTFVELMELWDFPFDVQDLSVLIESEMSPNDTRLENEPDEMHKIHKSSFMDEQEFYLYKYIDDESSVPALSVDQQIKPRMKVTINVARLPHYFLWNIFLIMNLIIVVSFLSFAIDVVQFLVIRLQHCFLMVLAVVTFKNVVNAHTPKISYFTYLDVYVLTSLLLLAGISSWHGFMTRVAESRRAEIDRIGLYCFLAFYVLFNVCFCSLVLLKPYRRRRKMLEEEKGYQRKYSAALKKKTQKAGVKAQTKR